jgi:hypothetical protein
MSNPKTLIGRAELVSFPTLGIKKIPAKIDTGADVSSIWVSKLKMVENELQCVFFGPESDYYTGEVIKFKGKDIDLTNVSNSFGSKELRYKVKIRMEIKKRIIKASFTLTDRSTKLYPILIGRSTLQGKFLVDVNRGSPLREEESERQERLKLRIKELKKELKL